MYTDEQKRELLRTAFATDRGRVAICQAMMNPARKRIGTSIARVALESKFIQPGCLIPLQYDGDAIYMPSNGAVPKYGPVFDPFFEIVAWQSHKPGLDKKPMGFKKITALMEEVSTDLLHQEEANFFAMANVAAKKSKSKNLAVAFEKLAEAGARTLVFSKFQIAAKELPPKISLTDYGMTYHGIPVIATITVPVGLVFGFKNKIGDFVTVQDLEVIPADEPTADQKRIKSYGYVFSETIGMVITKPENVLKTTIAK